ncbi:hypothetical protein KQX54_004056 [Cotesia glomerata]|uniref:Uncharacterized protein n=1 Tax=Cotesia glomerata TaxID=32391 RepID=A0AAV7I907_COTGL|nr:hypothetical protein KQX54_004056 [Cotesia glomerata]
MVGVAWWSSPQLHAKSQAALLYTQSPSISMNKGMLHRRVGCCISREPGGSRRRQKSPSPAGRAYTAGAAATRELRVPSSSFKATSEHIFSVVTLQPYARVRLLRRIYSNNIGVRLAVFVNVEELSTGDLVAGRAIPLRDTCKHQKR